jgi:hypothetical protein
MKGNKPKKLTMFLKNLNTKPGMVAHACNPSTQRMRKKDFEFEASLGYISSSR